jgi:hypothetical protein
MIALDFSKIGERQDLNIVTKLGRSGILWHHFVGGESEKNDSDF